MEIKTITLYEKPQVMLLEVDCHTPIAQSVTEPDGVVPDYDWGTF